MPHTPHIMQVAFTDLANIQRSYIILLCADCKCSTTRDDDSQLLRAVGRLPYHGTDSVRNGNK